MFDAIKKGLFSLNWREESAQESTVPDPAKYFPHAKNSELFAFLRRGWLEKANLLSVRVGGDYPFLTHPDLIERFRSFAPSADVVQGSAYGQAIMANSSGVVFAWAGGMNQIFLRLPRELQQQAISEAGRYDPTYGEEWIEFLAFGHRNGTRVDSEEALRRWIRMAYEDSLTIS